MRSLRDMPNPVEDPSHWAHTIGEPAVRTFDDYIGMTLDALDTGYGIYAGCFCENGDLLSQWRAYGSDHGYSVEFDPEALAHSIDVMSWSSPGCVDTLILSAMLREGVPCGASSEVSGGVPGVRSSDGPGDRQEHR
jgi:hypothetical protein